MPTRSIVIKVATEGDLRSYVGNDGHYFDLVDFNKVRSFNVLDTLPVSRFQANLVDVFGIAVQFQRIWLCFRRQNGTCRPSRPLSALENKKSVGSLTSKVSGDVKLFLEVLNSCTPRNLCMEDILVFLKLYDPEQKQLRYIGTLYVKGTSKPAEILHKLRNLAVFCPDEEIELYEEIKFEPVVFCEVIDVDRTFRDNQLENGDIICYQKSSKPWKLRTHPSVQSFLEHVHALKDEQRRKICALEEDIVVLKCKSDLQIEQAKMECSQLKHERDYAVRQVGELQDQNAQIILEFSFADLQQATEDFKDLCKIGDTEYGCVYKGIIHNTTVAIKMCRTGLFQQEVSVLRQGRHPNIVTLIGICSEASALVYEWLPRGNLEDHIVCSNGFPPLPWQIRTQIIGEVCCSLLFLHSYTPSALVHGDLRPCNILIDANYRSKLCNFGMSALFLQPGACPPNLIARHPYMDPEFLTTGDLTPLSDVYSLGVIILRLLTGTPALAIARRVSEAFESDSLHLLIDKSAGDWPYTQAKQLALLGLSCVEMTRDKRPDLLTKVWTVIEPLTRKPPTASWRFVQSASRESCTPSHFICPILKEIMNDPQMASDGFTYEAEAIKSWLDDGNLRSPMTNLALPNRDLIPNRALRSSIQEHLQQQQRSNS
ncbi:U-box domain-containing protein 57 isoform X1 [Lolium perenne]|uniref:U-box domain-containing protein 57 isoform X1 n=1 Tax=Lolium perenne TaxID=4522 RepID=UPI0021F65556|nr:U-box domain-containing protein 57-like isoform X1 [Lolium perenne]